MIELEKKGKVTVAGLAAAALLVAGALLGQVKVGDSTPSIPERVRALEVRSEDTHKLVEKIDGKVDRLLERMAR